MVRPYRWLAEYYDRHITFHLAWYEAARQEILSSILPKLKSACDLACGTGTTALILAKQGVRMSGVDLSPAMCKIARHKTRRLRPPVRIIRADMREFQLALPVDLVLCEFDALNHVTRKSDLALVARAVYRALRPGGHFYFDVNNRLAFQKIWPGTWWSEKPNVAFVMHGGYDRELDRGWTNIEWFLREGRLWRRRSERIEQVCWSATEIRQTLRQAGFKRIRSWDATPFFKTDPNIKPGCRTFYLAYKPAT